jgi:transcriptional regulator with XRE-family HTH domain
MKENTNLLYATKLYKLRRDADIKQPQLAEFLGVSQQAYSKLERGETNFSDDVIDAICHYFKISVSEFVHATDKSKSSSKSAVPIRNDMNLNTAIYDVLDAFLEEVKSNRVERQFYLQRIERLIQLVEKGN